MWCLNILIGALELEDFAHIFVLLNTAYVMFEDLDKKSTARD